MHGGVLSFEFWETAPPEDVETALEILQLMDETEEQRLRREGNEMVARREREARDGASN